MNLMFSSDVLVYIFMALPIRPLYGYTLCYLVVKMQLSTACDIHLFLFIAPACSRVRYRRPIFCPSVRQSVRLSVRLSTFVSKFDIYVKVSILINYKTKQPSNLA